MQRTDDRFYFRQLLAGLDFAEDDPIAQQMVNFVYLVGDRQSGEALVIDPAYDPAAILAIARADDMEVVGALGTHFHADHVGGDLMGHGIAGIRELLEVADVPIHLQADESPWVQRTTGVGEDQVVEHASGDVVSVGEVGVELIHTPGHTPGSQCFLVEGRLIAGDTLFLQGCGRTDLPGGDPAEMYRSLTQRLAKVPDDTLLFPGHLYSQAPSQPMGTTREANMVFRPGSEEEWLSVFA